MRDQSQALRSAIELLHMPTNVRRLRTSPLPDGVSLLLRAAVGQDDVLSAAAKLTRREREDVRRAAAFFIEQVMLDPNADSYRRLGTNRNAPISVLRQHMALLMSWLHPDIDENGERALFAERVTRAWDSIKTPERRQAYDRTLNKAVKSASGKIHATTQPHTGKGVYRRTRRRSSLRSDRRARRRGLFIRTLGTIKWKLQT